jgi:hypothetical protein
MLFQMCVCVSARVNLGTHHNGYRRLRVARTSGFREASIGDGGHTDYFSDVSFWTAVLNLVWGQSQPSSQPPPIPAASWTDTKEWSNLCDLAWLSSVVGILSGVFDAYICGTFVAPYASALVLLPSNSQ